MGSSGGGGTPRAPNMPAPPGGMISPQGSTAPFAPNYTSFLPTDPTAMATGLTPQMLASINAPPPRPVQQGPDMRAILSGMMAGRPGGMSVPRQSMTGPRNLQRRPEGTMGYLGNPARGGR